MEVNKQLKNVSIKLYSNMHVIKIKILFHYSTLYLFKIFVILDYDDPSKKKKSQNLFVYI